MDDVLHLIQQFLAGGLICRTLLLLAYLVIFRVGVECIVLKLPSPVIIHKVLGQISGCASLS